MPGVVSCISWSHRERIRQHLRVYATLPSDIAVTSAAAGMNPRPACPVRNMFGLVHVACFQATTFLSGTSDVHLGSPFLAEQRRQDVRSCISHSHRERHQLAITCLHKQQHVPRPGAVRAAARSATRVNGQRCGPPPAMRATARAINPRASTTSQPSTRVSRQRSTTPLTASEQQHVPPPAATGNGSRHRLR